MSAAKGVASCVFRLSRWQVINHRFALGVGCPAREQGCCDQGQFRCRLGCLALLVALGEAHPGADRRGSGAGMRVALPNARVRGLID
jgi:hypothetical protein